MKQKANKYSSYFTPKVLIVFAIFLIIINEPLFVLDEANTTLDLLLFILYFKSWCLIWGENFQGCLNSVQRLDI